MKTRTGFVSNSSSSSFMAVATVPAFREALTRMKETRNAKVVKVVATDEKVFGIPAKLVKEFTDAGGCSSIWGYDGDQQEEILEKAGVEIEEENTCPKCEGGDKDAECNCDKEEWYPSECIYEYTQILEDMAKEKDWKDQIFQCDVGDGG